MNYKEIIKKLTELGERQFETLFKARNIIEDELNNENILFSYFEFSTSLPKVLNSNFKINGEDIEHLPTTFVSGETNDNSVIISSLISSQDFLYSKNINFNPKCSIISKANYYFAPAVAINRENVLKISQSNDIKFRVEVEKIDCNLKSILVGNKINPKKIIFSHFDSIQSGAVDNASGTVICLDLIIKNKELLNDCLFVFDSNEELSYDEPIYWGHGYRKFEEKYFDLMKRADEIIIVDCIGHSTVMEYRNEKLLKLAFPIKNLEKLNNVCVISGEFDSLMEIYHSDDDMINCIKDNFYEECRDYILKKLIKEDKLSITR